jgi:indolepyruvate ferredoxin oxidoreductase alpha subunit
MVRLNKGPGEVVLLLGNEAIARGAIEAGVKFVTGYPGTPASEILEALVPIADKLNMYVNWAINEKVALEMAIGSAFCGVRSLVVMKHVGVNVAADPLMTLAYTGLKGGLVLISADDPQCHTSQTEQDNRHYAMLAKIPVLEPADPNEAKEMCKEAFSLSEDLELPVMLRTTPRVSHTTCPVTLGEIVKREVKPVFDKNIDRWVCVGPTALNRHKWLEQQQSKAKELLEKSIFNKVISESSDIKLGIITVGVAYTYVLDALRGINKSVSILKLFGSFPLPEKVIANFLIGKRRVLIIEELDLILEQAVRDISHKHAIPAKIMGKFDGLLPLEGELTPDHVQSAVLSFLGKSRKPKITNFYKQSLPVRPLSFCAGCPHRATYYVLKKALSQFKDKNYVILGDIGCYTIGKFAPFKMLDTCLCMGASIGTALGFALQSAYDHVIAVLGDSTFLHSGIPALINTVYNKANVKVLILDNEETAMTGHQPHPGVGLDAKGNMLKKVAIEDVVKGCGVNFVKIVDPYNLNLSLEVISEALTFNGPAVVIFRRECALTYVRKHKNEISRYRVDNTKCKKCLICIGQLSCPAIIKTKEDAVEITDSCTGCGVCAAVCPSKAIFKES